MSFWVYSGQSSRKGSSHETNDDALYSSDPGTLSTEGFLGMICDGVSSVPDGKWAAEQSCLEMQHYFEEGKKRTVEEYKKQIQDISTKIHQTNNKRGACTLSLCWIDEEKLNIFALGDTQIAFWRKGTLHVLTEDRQQSGGVRFFIGMRDPIAGGLQWAEQILEDNDVILIMSDGVSEIVSQRDFSHIWKHCYEDPQLCADKLVQFAHFSGSTDDNSVIVMHYRSQE